MFFPVSGAKILLLLAIWQKQKKGVQHG